MDISSGLSIIILYYNDNILTIFFIEYADPDIKNAVEKHSANPTIISTSTDTYQIRLVSSLEQLEFVIPLFDQYRVFYKQSSDIEGARKFLTERRQRKESIIFLAIQGSTPLGFCQLYPLFSSVRMCRTWYLGDLFVAHEGRKRGVGSNLLAKAKEFSLDTKGLRLMLRTAKDNFTGQSVYHQQGYIRDEEFYTYNLNLDK